MKNNVVLSVDLEFFTDTFAFQKLNRKWENGEVGEAGVEKLLELFEKHNIKSTFFVVGRFAKSHKQLLNRIRNGGHEIASHTMTHRSLLNLGDEEIAMEIGDSKKMLEDAVGDIVLGFRAPAFGIDAAIMAVVAQSGYKYDSSVVPCLRIPGWYGFPKAPKHPFNIRDMFPDMTASLMEFPVAVDPVLRLPLSGMWMRMFGQAYVTSGIKSLLRRDTIPIIYVHPWEIVDLPRLKGIPWRVYYGTGKPTLNIVEYIIKNVNAMFVPIRDLVGISV
jgi:peptidoglycan/xylan/chitin deacetylase (PgdA/CDA1 family)